ncbi:MAG: hypothetical protein DYG94_12950 [Leptolyngbya sp. PLA3]|nr:MAG: hypothetical protein EDM82_03125 [Cyanobacteria bacterium CYA]MCE7969633.1 hypothetical protein [Leptolyngbya sp. PL-A3]
MKTLAIFAVAGIAAAASAQISGSAGTTNPTNENVINLADFANISIQRGGGNATVTIEFTGDVESWDFELDSSNVVAVFDMGGPATIHGIGWDVTLSTVGASWLTEAYVNFGELGGTPGLYLHPGAGTNSPGTASYSSGGIIDLTDNGIPDVVMASGMLRLEFFESFDDVADAVDAYWRAGSTITLDMTLVPAPGALALLGLGGLAIRRRR